MKLYDVTRKELVDVIKDKKLRQICSDTRSLCINVEVATDFKELPENKVLKKYGINRAEYRKIVSSIPDNLETVIDEDINYKAEDEILDTDVSALNTSSLRLPPEALKRLNAIRKKNGYVV